MMNSDAFKGANVFMSRNLVPPEIFDTLHDALKNNGAKVFLCCDPSRKGPNDYHVISSMDHEKFEDLRAKGCNLLGPQCVLSCSMEHRALPQQGFTCCLAMDGVKVLASGFQEDEKAKIERLVTAMGGVLHVKASLDVSFVIVNSVLAAKYKWALNILKKPIVTIDWLYQCWNEHRIVPHKSCGVLAFSGLTISVTRIPADERKEIEKLIMNNGGKYSADLTKKCTHLICTAPEGDKYKVARTWGHINIVTRKWFDQSIARKACLNEESYQVLSSNKVVGGCLVSRHSQGKVISQSEASAFVAESKISAVSCSGFADSDLEATLSQNKSTFFESSPPTREGCDEVANTLPKNVQIDSCVADDSQSEDGDLYLSACRISLVGFEAPEMCKLVNMVRNGGGSRYMLLNDKLTHIVVGTPSEMEKKEVRDIAASGVIHVVCTTWLEDCDYKKKEIPVIRRHMAFDKLIPKDSNKGAGMGMTSLNQSKPSVGVNISSNQESMSLRVGVVSSMEKKVDEQLQINMSVESTDGATARMSNQSRAPGIDGINKGQSAMQRDFTVQNGISSCVFKGKNFQFSTSFPDDRRAEIEQWVTQGGGIIVDDHVIQNVHFRIECHGAIPKSAEVHQLTYVSSHWIRSCLEDGHLLDVRRHILYSPLPCSIPLLGLEKCRFCVSQYEDKDRILLRNLCFVLGAKFVEKLTKKVTHLVCKFASGPKYEAASKWGIHSITSEWICECVRQNKVVSMDSYRPKEVTAQDHEGGFCTTSQFPTQAVRMISGDGSSQFPSQHQDLKDSPMEIENGSYRRDDKESSLSNKKARLLEDSQSCLIPSAKNPTNYVSIVNEAKDNASKSSIEVIAPDVASAIEDLLEQTSKIRDQKSPKPGSDKSIFAPECSILGQDHSDRHSVIGLSKHWLNRTERKDGAKNPSRDGSAGLYDGFSETQTDSQVVGYEEDLSGRQMLIDRVRTRSSMI